MDSQFQQAAPDEAMARGRWPGSPCKKTVHPVNNHKTCERVERAERRSQNLRIDQAGWKAAATRSQYTIPRSTAFIS
jgi:hypothetical protein